MSQAQLLINVLAVLPDDWEIPWAGVGAFLLGVGGTLSGIAAVMTARRKGRDEATAATAVSRPDDGRIGGVSGGDSVESRIPNGDPNSNS